MTNFGNGGADAQGVWLFGENDARGPYASDLLNKQALTISAQLASIRNKAVCLKSTAQTFTTGTVATIAGYDVPIRSHTGLTFTPATGVFVCATAGLYRFAYRGEWANGATGFRYVSVEKAVAATPAAFVEQTANQVVPGSSGHVTTLSDFVYLSLLVGDVVRFRAAHTQGANLQLTQFSLEAALA